MLRLKERWWYKYSNLFFTTSCHCTHLKVSLKWIQAEDKLPEDRKNIFFFLGSRPTPHEKHLVSTFNPLPDYKILDQTKLKAFADDKLNVKKIISVIE